MIVCLQSFIQSVEDGVFVRISAPRRIKVVCLLRNKPFQFWVVRQFLGLQCHRSRNSQISFLFCLRFCSSCKGCLLLGLYLVGFRNLCLLIRAHFFSLRALFIGHGSFSRGISFLTCFNRRLSLHISQLTLFLGGIPFLLCLSLGFERVSRCGI